MTVGGEDVPVTEDRALQDHPAVIGERQYLAPRLGSGDEGADLERESPAVGIAVEEIEHVGGKSFPPHGRRLLDETERSACGQRLAHGGLAGTDVTFE